MYLRIIVLATVKTALDSALYNYLTITCTIFLYESLAVFKNCVVLQLFGFNIITI